ncbi:PD-(D/E)XK nuclease family protein [Methylobacillus gramineus]|uniref:PD-(D/E)XK nuclease family protein n=1 Tax=Methylobacillus gramineus TaxID=755169 RepID=UPI001CFFAB56|nr:PD-(D/E)XK nuclease family protein [Methylobacillus gramineus]MCB5184599.1 PD-(D/E)XK nuclease family protein [Methylobacillus gramineus]
MTTTDSVILCATARLVRALQLDHDQAQSASGLKQWPSLPASTVSLWLDGLFEQALLTGELELEQAPAGMLSSLQERMLWEQVIADSLSEDMLQALFDIKGLALAAQEAHRLLLEWRLPAPEASQSEEVTQFLAWRREFNLRCQQSGWLEAPRYFNWQVNMLAQGLGRLPDILYFAGFDRITPQVAHLQEVLAARGVRVQPYNIGLSHAGHHGHVTLPDQEAECRAAVGWAAALLQQNPQARLGIVVPELAKLRNSIASLLDDVLHPAWVRPASVEAPRHYDFSLGLPLDSQPVVQTALALLRFFTQYKVEQQAFSSLLHQPYWSAAVSEGDARAQLDARMREWLPLSISMPRLLKFVRQAGDGERPIMLKQLQFHMQSAISVLQGQPRQQRPSAWASTIREVLDALAWPGQRSRSSFEFQAIKAFEKALQALATLDVLVKPMKVGEAIARLNELCREQIFQPEAEGNVQIQVMGMLESVSKPLDGLWVMGMNDHVWPPAPRPNPLLPAAMQRSAGLPNADSAVQAAFATIIHQRLLKSAHEVIFSSAEKEGERELRLSPMVMDIAVLEYELPQILTLAERLAIPEPDRLQFIDDHLAPVVGEGEHVSGGTGLLKAQAICPAWAYFQYRLHARALKAPVNGLDAAERGTLVHAVLEHFWLGRGLAELQAMDEPALSLALAVAVTAGLDTFAKTCDEPLSSAFIALETERLIKLVGAWLHFEKTRETDFRVLASEQKQQVKIEGVDITLIIDRIDLLEDGRRIIMDYKTGRKPDTKNWAETRITEPQLPVYAAFSLADEHGDGEIAAICFAMVKTAEHAFAGLSADVVLPAVPGLDEKKARELFPESDFPDWHSVLAHWRDSVTAIVQELKSGEAAVRLNDEKQLAYCEVLPLLRIPERRLQFERQQAQAGDGR